MPSRGPSLSRCALAGERARADQRGRGAALYSCAQARAADAGQAGGGGRQGPGGATAGRCWCPAPCASQPSPAAAGCEPGIAAAAGRRRRPLRAASGSSGSTRLLRSSLTSSGLAAVLAAAAAWCTSPLSRQEDGGSGWAARPAALTCLAAAAAAAHHAGGRYQETLKLDRPDHGRRPRCMMLCYASWQAGKQGSPHWARAVSTVYARADAAVTRQRMDASLHQMCSAAFRQPSCLIWQRMAEPGPGSYPGWLASVHQTQPLRLLPSSGRMQFRWGPFDCSQRSGRVTLPRPLRSLCTRASGLQNGCCARSFHARCSPACKAQPPWTRSQRGGGCMTTRLLAEPPTAAPCTISSGRRVRQP
jgi:hypothetical protein